MGDESSAGLSRPKPLEVISKGDRIAYRDRVRLTSKSLIDVEPRHLLALLDMADAIDEADRPMVEKLELGADDILLIQTKDRLPRVKLEQMQADILDTIGDDHRVLVVDAGVTVAVVKRS